MPSSGKLAKPWGWINATCIWATGLQGVKKWTIRPVSNRWSFIRSKNGSDYCVENLLPKQDALWASLSLKCVCTMNTIEEIDKQAYDQAIRWLARRAYGAWELQQRLLQVGMEAEGVARVCARCRALGYLDDAAFALSRARYRLHRGGYGPRRVWGELRALQVAETHIQQALDQLLEENDAVALATVALAKRFGPGGPGKTGRRELKRKYDSLSRRGFNDETIWQLLK